MARPLLTLALLVAAVCASPATAAAKLPKSFLWGVATAGFQGDMGPGVPNDPNSDWWAWVRDPQNIQQKRVSGDLPEQGGSQWTKYKQDIALARKKLNANTYRFSIEWSRVFPTTTEGAHTTGEVDAIADQSAIKHYRDELTAIRKAGMTPFVTINHFTLPLWLHDPIAARNAFAGVGPDDPAPTGFGPAGWLDPRAPAQARGVDQLLFARKERVTGRTNFHVQIFFPGRARLKGFAAGAGHCDFLIFRMNSGFHFFLTLYSRQILALTKRL